MTHIFTRWIATIILTFTPALVPVFAYAQTPAQTTTTYQTTATAVTVPSTVGVTPKALGGVGGAQLITLHTRCDTEITTRLTSLNQALTRLNSIKKLTTEQQAQYTTAIQSNITGLNTLKVKCDADTDAATLQADTKSIVTTYRIYLEFIPQTSLLAAAGRLNDVSSQFSILISKLQTRIADAQAQGEDVTNLQDDLTVMQAKFADIATQTATITSQVGSLQPANVNTDQSGTKTNFEAARAALQTAQTDVKDALADAKIIVAGLLALPTPAVSTGTPSAATTTTVIPPTTVMTVAPTQ